MEAVLTDLRTARRRRGLTQREVAGAMGTTQSAVARLESGRTSPRLETLVSYAEAVGGALTVGSQDLLGGCAATIREVLGSGDADAALRAVVQFVDDTRRADLPDEVLRREPPSTGDRRWDAAIAAAAAWVAGSQDCDPPGWAAAPSRFLDGPWFVLADVIGRPVTGRLAAHLLANCPAEFFGRGVIIDADTLQSV